MIIYSTKQTLERYKLKLPEELTQPMKTKAETIIRNEEGDKINQWGAKLFYFDRRKCIQIVNFASKFTLFLVDIKVADLENIGIIIVKYLFELYKNDPPMEDALKKLFKKNPEICFAKLTDKSAIATLNYTQRYFLSDGDRLYDYIENGILMTVEINRKVNFEWLVSSKLEGENNYFYPGEKFREVILDKYGKNK